MSGQPEPRNAGGRKDRGKEKETGPRPPPRTFMPPVVVSFVSGGHIVAIGDINKHAEQDLQAVLTLKHTGTDLPYLGFRIKLRRSPDTVHLYQGQDQEGDNSEFHVITYRYYHGNYTIESGKANLEQKERFLNVSGGSASAQTVCADDKLYIVKISHDEGSGPEIHGYGSSFVAANEALHDKYNHLSSIPTSHVVDLFMWEKPDLPDFLQWSLSNQATQPDPLKHYYMSSKHTSKPQGYVQWGRIPERDQNMLKPFERRQGYHDFDNFVVMQGNSEAYEQLHFFDISKELRALEVSMSVLRPEGSKGDYFFGFLHISQWERYQRLFDPLDKVLIMWTPPPEIVPQFLKEEGEKDPKDDAAGWWGTVMEDNILSSYAPLMILLRRPGEGQQLRNKKMSAAESVNDHMPVQRVYIKTFPSAITVKARLKALDKHRYRNNPSVEFEEKRRTLVGRDLEIKHTTDLLKDIPQRELEQILHGLNPSQLDCLMNHCRNIPHGINMILGPFGSGKTVLVSKLCELQKAQKPDSKIFVTASSNSACDAVVPKFEGTDLMVVRAHALSLERETLMDSYFEAQRAGILAAADPLPDDYEPPENPNAAQRSQKISAEGAEEFELEQATGDQPTDAIPDHDMENPTLDNLGNEENGGGKTEEAPSEHDAAADDGHDADPMLKATLDIMKICQQKYNSRRTLENPKDTRMQEVNVAIHTWILKFAGIIESEYSVKSTTEEPSTAKAHLFNVNTCTSFRSLYEKSKTNKLNTKEWLTLKNDIETISQAVLRAADVVIATAVQGQTDLLKDIVFDHVIFDESSVLTHTELLCAWRGNEVLTLIGDLKQLPSTVLSTTTENPFAIVQGYGPFQRFADMGIPMYVLKHVMRMTAGLEDVCNQIFYGGKLVCGPGTSVSDPRRRLSTIIQDTFQKTPDIHNAPVDRVYPIFLHLPGICFQEADGSSRMNTHNIALIIHLIEDLLDALPDLGYNLRLDQIGIASPYAAQVNETRQALRRANLEGIKVGVTESWQGDEKDIMIVDFVRAKNPDLGSLGFLTKKERLNVLLSRQKQFLFVVGDKTCCETSDESADPPPLEVQDETTDTQAPATWNINDRKNAYVSKVLTWFREHGRVLDIPIAELTEDYVKFPRPEDEEPAGDGGWGDPEPEKKDEQGGEEEVEQKEDEKVEQRDEMLVENQKLKEELMKMKMMMGEQQKKKKNEQNKNADEDEQKKKPEQKKKLEQKKKAQEEEQKKDPAEWEDLTFSEVKPATGW